MKLTLYTHEPPVGNTVALARALSSVTGIGATESMQLAMGVFAGQHNSDNCLVLVVSDGDALGGLRAICAQCGILIKEEKS